MIRKVHVVFKTHLDIGFTDLAESVVHHYLHRFIPLAIQAAEEANKENEPPKFVWTVGSYLIDLALRELDGDSTKRLDAAIRHGHINYHALPFTTHSELCSDRLFDSGLSIARRLDERFGRHTIAAKMSDVPGHTSGIIAPLARAGVRFLHIGINTVARMPQVPALFMWENASGQRLMVNYTRSYGGLTLTQGHDEALYFMHTDDNTGPPSIPAIERCFEDLRRAYPEAEVFASTLDSFAAGLLKLESSLPVIKGEIGDTWIHGIGVDPKKTAMLRALDRLAEDWDKTNTWQDRGVPDGRPLRAAYLEQLLLVCEHTWGLDLKKYLTDFANWSRPSFEAARQADVLLDEWGLGRGYDDCFQFARQEFERLKPEHLLWKERRYSLFEASHQEQRDYIQKALDLLPEELKNQADKALDIKAPDAIDQNRPQATNAALGNYALRYEEGKIHVSQGASELFSLRLPLYQEVGLAAYDKLCAHYLTDMEKNRDWAVPDNAKPGLEDSDAPYESRNHWPKLICSALSEGGWQMDGRFDPLPAQTAGCPEGFRMRFDLSGANLLVTLYLYHKAANRKPEALYLPFELNEHRNLRLRKIDEGIDPSACIPGGNLRSHGIQSLIYESHDGQVRISPLDTPLVCLGAPSPLDFDGEKDKGKIYFNLYNNLWGTNFKMWYEEDMVCRFLVET